jgi:AhpD family alkylhydroperoxidase
MTIDQDKSQSRLPNPAVLVPELGEIGKALFKATGNGSVPQATISLVQLRAGQIVGNTYLTVLHTGNLRKAGQSEERITAVASWQDAPYFTDAERAALALAEAMTRLADRSDAVPDGVWDQVARHFDEKQCAALVVWISTTNLFNRLNVATAQQAPQSWS